MPPDALHGPGIARLEDIDPINRLFSEAFTDRYQRDGMTGVRVPNLNPAIWRFAIAHAGAGALVWRDADGDLVAFNLVHQSGGEGWMGPLVVRPDRQGSGVGARIVREGIRRLEAGGATVIGLETMPRTVENIGFYSGLGFRPGHLTVSLTRDLAASRAAAPTPALVDEAQMTACLALTDAVMPGVDFSREIGLTLAHRLGGLTSLEESGRLLGFALWHSAALAEGRSGDELRVLKLVARDLTGFHRLLDLVEADAARVRARRVSLRCQTGFRAAYGALIERGYRVHWTDLRMTLEGKNETPPMGEGVCFSNWEI